MRSLLVFCFLSLSSFSAIAVELTKWPFNEKVIEGCDGLPLQLFGTLKGKKDQVFLIKSSETGTVYLLPKDKEKLNISAIKLEQGRLQLLIGDCSYPLPLQTESNKEKL